MIKNVDEPLPRLANSLSSHILPCSFFVTRCNAQALLFSPIKSPRTSSLTSGVSRRTWITSLTKASCLTAAKCSVPDGSTVGATRGGGGIQTEFGPWLVVGGGWMRIGVKGFFACPRGSFLLQLLDQVEILARA